MYVALTAPRLRTQSRLLIPLHRCAPCCNERQALSHKRSTPGPGEAPAQSSSGKSFPLQPPRSDRRVRPRALPATPLRALRVLDGKEKDLPDEFLAAQRQANQTVSLVQSQPRGL